MFFVTNLPRLLLNLYELYNVNKMIKCGDLFVPPTWFICSTSINHLLLILNFIMNFVVRNSSYVHLKIQNKIVGKIHKNFSYVFFVVNFSIFLLYFFNTEIRRSCKLFESYLFTIWASRRKYRIFFCIFFCIYHSLSPCSFIKCE